MPPGIAQPFHSKARWTSQCNISSESGQFFLYKKLHQIHVIASDKPGVQVQYMMPSQVVQDLPTTRPGSLLLIGSQGVGNGLVQHHGAACRK